MLIRILVLLATIVLFTIGRFLLTHIDKPFMMLHPENNKGLGKIVKFFGIVFCILAVFSAIAIFLPNIFFVTTIMVISCIMLLVMELMLLTFLTK
ncbi:hypothetical protein RZ56_06270 [Apilactobacillus kunkeei]|nr:hypothetical protein RZ56_06270 [Apilactobacillus kunkeei]